MQFDAESRGTPHGPVAYYRVHPAQLNPLLPIDAVFPAFIGTELPMAWWA